MSATVFLGPTLAHAEASARLDADLRGPAALGDVHGAVRRGSRTILLVDGLFETVRTVWHKELLWALAQGVSVVGAASLGALRAVELEPFGMIGVGEVFHAYRTGLIEDDAEVAVLHGPAELGWRPLTLALVDVRATLAAAAAQGVLTSRDGDLLLQAATCLHYKDRGWHAVLDAGARLGCGGAAALGRWLPAGRVDAKRCDALAALDLVAAGLPSGRCEQRFVETVFWRRLAGGIGEGRG